MRIKRRFKNDKFAVSVVIGIVLLVAVSVSLSGAVLSYATERTDKPVTGGLEQNIRGIAIATSDGTLGTLQFVAPKSGQKGKFEFIVTGLDGETVVIVTPEDIDMTSSGVAGGDVVNIKSLVEEAFGDTVGSGEYTITCRNTDEIFTKRIIGTYEFDLTFESNNPPNEPSIPSPVNGATAISINADLSWSGGDPDGDDTLTYDVYFEEGDSDPDVLVSDGQSSTSYDPGTLEYDETYYWKIVASDDHDAQTEGQTWHFTVEDEPNSPPYLPSDSDPEDGATGLSIDVDLSWSGGDPDGDDTVTYDVYLEAGDSTPDVLVSDGQSSTSYDPGTLEYDETYYWKIVASDDHDAQTEGQTWRFTAEDEPNPPYPPSDPNPQDGETNKPITAHLSWTGGDPDPGDTVTYDVYFGATNPPPKVVSNQSGTTYDPGSLGYTKTYYWKIIAWDSDGASTEGDIWSFTTKLNKAPIGGGSFGEL